MFRETDPPALDPLGPIGSDHLEQETEVATAALELDPLSPLPPRRAAAGPARFLRPA